jgi:hypothetical protein
VKCVEEMLMSEQLQVPTKPTTKKKAAKPKAAKKAKTTAKKTRPAKEENLVVFAFRLSQVERDAIHKTAGPARASRYVRQVAAAFASEDEAAFRAVIKEAREGRR